MIHINELVLKLEGIDGLAGRRIGETVARRMADRLPTGSRNQYVDAIHLRISVSPGMDQEQVIDAIAEHLINQIKIAFR